jgi:hypothetical protein
VCSREAYQSLGMVQEWCNTRDAHPQVHCWPGARAASFSAPFHTSGYCMQKGVQILSCTMHWLSTIFARWDRSLHSQSWHPNREHQPVVLHVLPDPRLLDHIKDCEMKRTLSKMQKSKAKHVWHGFFFVGKESERRGLRLWRDSQHWSLLSCEPLFRCLDF